MPIKQKILHFDTVDAVGNFDTKYYNSLGSVQNMASQAFNTRLSMSSAIKNIKSISLKSVEFPFQQFNVRSTNTSIQMRVIYNGISKTENLTIKEKNYTDILSLLTDLNTAFATKISSITELAGFFVVFSLNPLNNKVLITSNPDRAEVAGIVVYGNLILEFSKLLYNILGFYYINNYDANKFYGVLGSTTDLNSYLPCAGNYNLQPDNYFNMSFTNIETSPSNANGNATTFKIPLNGSYGEVIYYTVSDGSEQKVYIDRPNTTLDYLNLVITDRWGFPVYSNGANISFTLNIEYEEMY